MLLQYVGGNRKNFSMEKAPTYFKASVRKLDDHFYTYFHDESIFEDEKDVEHLIESHRENVTSHPAIKDDFVIYRKDRPSDRPKIDENIPSSSVIFRIHDLAGKIDVEVDIPLNVPLRESVLGVIEHNQIDIDPRTEFYVMHGKKKVVIRDFVAAYHYHRGSQEVVMDITYDSSQEILDDDEKKFGKMEEQMILQQGIYTSSESVSKRDVETYMVKVAPRLRKLVPVESGGAPSRKTIASVIEENTLDQYLDIPEKESSPKSEDRKIDMIEQVMSLGNVLLSDEQRLAAMQSLIENSLANKRYYLDLQSYLNHKIEQEDVTMNYTQILFDVENAIDKDREFQRSLKVHKKRDSKHKIGKQEVDMIEFVTMTDDVGNIISKETQEYKEYTKKLRKMFNKFEKKNRDVLKNRKNDMMQQFIQDEDDTTETMKSYDHKRFEIRYEKSIDDLLWFWVFVSFWLHKDYDRVKWLTIKRDWEDMFKGITDQFAERILKWLASEAFTKSSSSEEIWYKMSQDLIAFLDDNPDFKKFQTDVSKLFDARRKKKKSVPTKKKVDESEEDKLLFDEGKKGDEDDEEKIQQDDVIKYLDLERIAKFQNFERMMILKSMAGLPMKDLKRAVKSLNKKKGAVKGKKKLTTHVEEEVPEIEPEAWTKNINYQNLSKDKMVRANDVQKKGEYLFPFTGIIYSEEEMADFVANNVDKDFTIPNIREETLVAPLTVLHEDYQEGKRKIFVRPTYEDFDVNSALYYVQTTYDKAESNAVVTYDQQSLSIDPETLLITSIDIYVQAIKNIHKGEEIVLFIPNAIDEIDAGSTKKSQVLEKKKYTKSVVEMLRSRYSTPIVYNPSSYNITWGDFYKVKLHIIDYLIRKGYIASTANEYKQKSGAVFSHLRFYLYQQYDKALKTKILKDKKLDEIFQALALYAVHKKSLMVDFFYSDEKFSAPILRRLDFLQKVPNTERFLTKEDKTAKTQDSTLKVLKLFVNDFEAEKVADIRVKLTKKLEELNSSLKIEMENYINPNIGNMNINHIVQSYAYTLDPTMGVVYRQVIEDFFSETNPSKQKTALKSEFWGVFYPERQVDPESNMFE